MGSSVPLLKALCIGQFTVVQLLLVLKSYFSFDVVIPPADTVTLPLVLIGAPVVLKISALPPEVERTKFVLLPEPTVY
jgi:hypothetical protein